MKILAVRSDLIKMYELERQRRNITPREFYWQCRKDLRTRFNVELEEWISYSEWVNPSYPEPYRRFKHTDDDGYAYEESYKYQPYDVQLYLQDAYNFIIEFEFDDDKKGFGYMYVIEYER